MGALFLLPPCTFGICVDSPCMYASHLAFMYNLFAYQCFNIDSFDWIPQFITGDFDSIKEDVMEFYKGKV